MRKITFAVAFTLIICFAASAAANDDAVVSTMKMRAWMQRDIDNTFLLFGDKIEASKTCYEAAISNFVADEWTAIAKAFGCADDEALCNKDPKAMEEVNEMLQKSGGNTDNEHDREVAYKAVNVWYLAATMYKVLRKLHFVLDPNDDANSLSAQRESRAEIEQKAQPLTPQQMLADRLNQYVGKCGSLKPVAWTIPGNALPEDDRITGVSVRLGMQALLTGYVMAQQLPAEDRGYIGCINAWNEAERSRNQCNQKSCADVVPADDRDALKAKLEELKAHQCDLTYALQMIPVTDTAQPVKP